MLSTYAKISIGGKDFTEFTTNLKVISVIEEDSTTEITLESDFYSFENIKLPKLKRGMVCVAEYGSVGTTKVVTSTVMEVNEKITNGNHTITVLAINKGVSLKRNSSRAVYNNITLKELVNIFASKHNLTAIITSTSTKVWECIPQGGMSDFKLLQYLVERDSGNDIIYCDSDKIYFEPKGFSKKLASNTTNYQFTSLSLSHKKLTSNDTDFSILDSEGTQHGGEAKEGYSSYVGNLLTSKEPKATFSATTGKVISKVTNNSNSDNNASINEVITKNSKVTAEKSEEAKAIKNSKDNKKTYEVISAEMVLDVTLKVNHYILIQNVHERFNGKWFIDELTDEVSAEAFYTTLTLNKIGHIYKNDSDNTISHKSSEGGDGEGISDKIGAFLGSSKEPKDKRSAITGKIIK